VSHFADSHIATAHPATDTGTWRIANHEVTVSVTMLSNDMAATTVFSITNACLNPLNKLHFPPISLVHEILLLLNTHVGGGVWGGGLFEAVLYTR
jgi:hypothetical protein